MSRDSERKPYNEEQEHREFDEHSLPPRSDYHAHKKTKTKFKFKVPGIRVLALIFVLVPLLTFGIYNAITKSQDNNFEEIEDKNSESVNVEDSTSNIVTPFVVTPETEGEKKSKNETKDKKVEDKTANHKSIASVTEASITNTEQTDLHDKDKALTEIDPTNDPNKKETEKKEQPKKQETTDDASERIVKHTVQPKETLYRISMQYFHSQEGMDKIRQWNGIQGNDIQVGQVLTIHLQK